MFLKSLKNNKGFTLVEIMVAAGILGGLAIVMFQISKDQAGTMLKSKVNTDVGQFKSEVIQLFGVPTNCNANVATLNVGTNTPITAINVCAIRASAGCMAATAGSRAVRFPVYTPATGTEVWPQTSTRISDRVRVKSISAVLTGATGVALSTAKFTITLETKPALPRTTNAGTSAQVVVLKDEIVEVNVPVVMSGSTVLGCPKSWNSTVPY